ncbi:hypothetical protein [Vreelandella sulfidaeris]|uniref:hypothetical protein n=1 Tax=Vreelandella sulfidaeris TaxID=115553 RepID=UPI0035E9FD1D
MKPFHLVDSCNNHCLQSNIFHKLAEIIMSFSHEENLEKIESLGDHELHALMRAWIEAQHEYSALHSSFEMVENGWWHNERASISLLAGAAWKSGWVALEEFGTTKRGHTVESEERGDRIGRCDLYLCNRKVSLAIEAKQAWQGLGNHRNDRKSFQDQLTAAWDDAGYLHSYEADRRFAVTFIVPHFPCSQVWNNELDTVDGLEVRTRIEDWLEEVEAFQRQRGKSVQYAYYFPADGFKNLNVYTGRVFPGVVIVMEERLRGV